MTQEQELRLIRQVLQGNANAFEPLVTAYEKTAYNLALRMLGNPEDAQDVTQEAFLKAYRSLSAFRGDCRFLVWFSRIVSNLCLDHLRSQKRRPSQSLTVENEEGETVQQDLADESFSPEALLERKWTRDAVRRGLDSLSPELRQILLLREIQGLSYEEIGTALGLEAGTVKSRIFRARKRLCSFLLRDGNLPASAPSERIGGGEAP